MSIDSIAHYELVSSIALEFPEVLASTSYGTPAFKVNKKLIARFWEDGRTLVIYTQERAKWMKKNPAIFFITPHYKDHPWILVNLVLVNKKDLRELFRKAWQVRASRRLLKK
jgi:hypothetical protein